MKNILIIASILFSAIILHTQPLCAEANTIGQQVHKGQNLLNVKMHLKKNPQSIKECFEIIQESGISLSFNPYDIDFNTKITQLEKDLTAVQLLDAILDKKTYDIVPIAKQNKILIIKKEIKYTLSGYIKEKDSHEALIGASVDTENGGYGSASNTYGFYCITLPKGKNRLVISYLGYSPQTLELDLTEDRRVDIFMEPASAQLQSIVVTATTDQSATNGSNVKTSELDNMPQLLGTKDFLKQLQFLMGTGGGAAGSSKIQVRGGKADNNLVLLDDVPLYNYNHITGFLSVFNSDALKYANFYKGRFPARYSGRISSVADIRMRDGDMNSYHGGVTFDLVTMSAFLEGPIKRDKSSFLVSTRRSWIDWFTRLFGKDNKFDCAFHDINLKLNYAAGSKDHIYYSFYSGGDHYINDNLMGNQTLSWGSGLMSVRWNHIFNNKVFMNTTAYASRFKNKLSENEVENYFSDTVSLNNSYFNYLLTEYSIASNINYSNEYYNFKGGVGFTGNNYQNRRNKFNEINSSGNNINALKLNLFIENNIKLADKLQMDVGLNYSIHFADNTNFSLFDPRIQLTYTPHKRLNYYIGFSRMNQFFHQISTAGVALPYELRLPSSKDLNPETSQLYEAGVNYRSKDNRHGLSGSIFYNKQKNILTYRFTQDMYNEEMAPSSLDQICVGSRRGNGIEGTYSGNFKKTDIHVSATFSNINEKFTQKNENKYFPSGDYSKVVIQSYLGYKFNRSKSVQATITYTSGKYISVPSYVASLPNTDENIPNATSTLYYYNHINNYKLKDNVQASVGYTYKKFYAKGGESTFQVGIYNLIGRGAPYYSNVNKSLDMITVSNTYLPYFAPYFSYSYRF